MVFNQQDNDGMVDGVNVYIDFVIVCVYWVDCGVDFFVKMDIEFEQVIVNVMIYFDVWYFWVGWQ